MEVQKETIHLFTSSKRKQYINTSIYPTLRDYLPVHNNHVRNPHYRLCQHQSLFMLRKSISTTLGSRDSIFPTTIFRCSFSCIKGILFISRNIASKISSKSIIRHIPVQESCQWMPHIQHNKTKFVDLGSALLGAASN